MTVTTIFIIIICVAAVIGGVIGIFKKATGLPFWGATVLISVFISWLVARLAPSDSGIYSWLVLSITVGTAVLFTLLFGLVKKFLNKRIERAKEYSHYKNTDKREENTEYMLNAVDNKDKKQYRKLRKKGRKIKDSSGGWGVVNRVLGFVIGGIEWLVAVGSVICALLLFVEFCGISQVQSITFLQELITSDGWVKIGAKLALDMLLVGTLVIALKAGFNKGISHLITFVVVIAMLAGFGFASWAIASSEACGGIVTSLQNGLLSQMGELDTAMGTNVTPIVAQLIIAAVIFLLSLVLVVLTGIFLPKLIDKFRDNDAYYVIDGVLGAVVSVVLLLAVYIALGGIAYTLNDLTFMAKFNSYEFKSHFANAFYGYNPFGYLFGNLPIHDWFVG